MEKILQTLTTYHGPACGVVTPSPGGQCIRLCVEYKPDLLRKSQPYKIKYMSQEKLPSVDSLNSRLQQNQKRTPAIYAEETLGNLKNVFPAKENGKFWRLKTVQELTKKQLADTVLMKAYKKDTLLSRARNQFIAGLINLGKIS